MKMITVEGALARGLAGEPLTVDEAMALSEIVETDALCDVADKVRERWTGDRVDTCSIVNARSGRCGEDCKWCAQSRHHATGIKEYEFVPLDDVLEALAMNDARHVGRFSLVTSGRRVSAAHMPYFCNIYREIRRRSNVAMCASMGLLGKEELQALYEAGVRRYHCNLETSESYFGELCTTHSHRDKLATIRAAREVGMEICCGGIIGMGESLRQRLELVEEAREAGACSIPINILQPIPGTALADTPLIDEADVVLTVALCRLIAPKVTLRFAGGRARLSDGAMRRILRGGMNGALVGDLLTTIGNGVDDDYAMFKSCGLVAPE